MLKNKNVVVYGLGNDYNLFKDTIDSYFNIVGYSDKKVYNIQGYLPLESIMNIEYDYIYIF